MSATSSSSQNPAVPLCPPADASYYAASIVGFDAADASRYALRSPPPGR
ncbi:hypothetical protein [Salinicola acroporae]|nr:hypothetical protein [Salinicola acroporae]